MVKPSPHISAYILVKQDISTLWTWNIGSQILLVTSHLPPHHISLQQLNDALCPNGGDHMLAFLEWHWSACFSAFLEMGILWLDWAGPGWVVEGNRQLEMGANVECEELGCVVGGPFKPNKLREVRGLVWRPWINKPSEMTMRCADICHHTALSSKHKPPKPSLPLSHVLCPTWSVSLPPSLPHLFHFISYTLRIFFLTPPSSFISSATLLLLNLLPPPPHLHSSTSCLPSDSIHPSVHPCMHGWPSVRGSACAIGRATEPLWHSAVAQQPRRPGFRPTKFIYRGERLRDGSQLHFFSVSRKDWVKVHEWVE